ncbi:MAG: TetR/AcrR family transcriptional regulator, partial [Acidothermales bacterium]|nr:TetR/AcrR family transcriptional regulator [Acidothermales bacterium]
MATSKQPSARERLLATATTLFYERGITATGVDTVVAESGVSKPTLYAHFRTKEQLVAAVLADRDARRRTEIPAWVDAHARAPRAKVLAVFDWLEAFYADGGARGCAFVNAAAEIPDPDSPARLAA